MDAKYIARARYLAPSAGSCHDFCKHGHKNNENDIKPKETPSPRKALLRTQSERKYVPDVSPSAKESPKKTAFKCLSLPRTRLERQTQLPSKEVKTPKKGNESKTPRKKPVINSTLNRFEEKNPVSPRRVIPMKFKKATAMVLSNVNGCPKELMDKRPENKGEDQNDSSDKLIFRPPKRADQNGEVEDEKIVLKKVEARKEEGEGENSYAVSLKHHEATEKNGVEETAVDPMLRRKHMVKTLVGAFEALISVGDRTSLMAASAC